jgi:hypothetical protein
MASTRIFELASLARCSDITAEQDFKIRLTELASTEREAWARESFKIAKTIDY